jgi:hypothetical protein
MRTSTSTTSYYPGSQDAIYGTRVSVVLNALPCGASEAEMIRYLLHHSHEASRCGVAYAAFKGDTSPLRHGTAVASCHAGGHEMWWVVDAGSADEALGQLPHFLATRSPATQTTEVQIL